MLSNVYDRVFPSIRLAQSKKPISRYIERIPTAAKLSNTNSNLVKNPNKQPILTIMRALYKPQHT